MFYTVERGGILLDWEQLFSSARGRQEQVIGWRREFHRRPELCWQEFWTTARIVEILEGAGIPVLCGPQVLCRREMRGFSPQAAQQARSRAARWGADPGILARLGECTGAVALLETGRPGPTVALRFDMDALPLQESREPEHRPFAEGFYSQNPGVMHACGHDGHIAIGLGVALSVWEHLGRFNGRIKLLFQPGEEGARGAHAMSESGIVDAEDLHFSGHLGLDNPGGQLAALYEGALASSKFDVVFTGASAHAASAPQEGKNALLAACSAVLGMYALCQDARGEARLNVGTLQGGCGRNIVPGRAVLGMETRGSSDQVEQRLFQAALQACQGAARMYGCETAYEMQGYAPCGQCDEELLGPILQAAGRVPAWETVVPRMQMRASEDVFCLMNRVRQHGGKAAYLGLGAGLAAPHHSAAFDFDESALGASVQLYLSLLGQFSGR